MLDRQLYRRCDKDAENKVRKESYIVQVLSVIELDHLDIIGQRTTKYFFALHEIFCCDK